MLADHIFCIKRCKYVTLFSIVYVTPCVSTFDVLSDENSQIIRLDENYQIIRLDENYQIIRLDENNQIIRLDENKLIIRLYDNNQIIRVGEYCGPWNIARVLAHNGNNKPIVLHTKGKLFSIQKSCCFLPVPIVLPMCPLFSPCAHCSPLVPIVL